MSVFQTAAEMIEEAIILIDNEGWTQGKLIDENGRCILGGLGRVASLRRISRSRSEWWEAYYSLFNAIKDDGSGLAPDVADYNDAPGRTWPECRDTMMSAAKSLREKG